MRTTTRATFRLGTRTMLHNDPEAILTGFQNVHVSIITYRWSNNIVIITTATTNYLTRPVYGNSIVIRGCYVNSRCTYPVYSVHVLGSLSYIIYDPFFFLFSFFSSLVLPLLCLVYLLTIHRSRLTHYRHRLRFHVYATVCIPYMTACVRARLTFRQIRCALERSISVRDARQIEGLTISCSLLIIRGRLILKPILELAKTGGIDRYLNRYRKKRTAKIK